MITPLELNENPGGKPIVAPTGTVGKCVADPLVLVYVKGNGPISGSIATRVKGVKAPSGKEPKLDAVLQTGGILATSNTFIEKSWLVIPPVELLASIVKLKTVSLETIGVIPLMMPPELIDKPAGRLFVESENDIVPPAGS